jgi:acyl-coenzyme A synthetase/AMP-(fatty) acid ligase
LTSVCFESGDAVLHDIEGTPLPPDKIRREYRAIKGFLLDNFREDEIAAIRLDFGYRYLLCIGACMDVGVPYLPLRSGWPDARIEQIRRLTGFSRLIDEAGIEDICRHPRPSSGTGFRPEPSKALYVICTSGSTGEPKAVVIERRSYENFLHWLDSYFSGLSRDSRLLLASDFTFDLSLFDVGLFFLKRCSLHLTRFDGSAFRLAHEIERYRIDSLTTLPNTIDLLLHETVAAKADLSSLRSLQVGGAWLSEALYRRMFAKLPASLQIHHFYGPTEATVYSHVKRLTGAAEEVVGGRVCVGAPIEGVSCRLAGPEGGEIREPGIPGELLLGGTQVMRGYFGDPDRTRECVTVIDGVRYYRTGDVAFLDRKGECYIAGRRDETIKRRGHRVNLLDIDAYIQRIDTVENCMTIAWPDPQIEHVLVSYVVARRPTTVAALRTEMAKTLVDYQLPDYIEFVARLPTNESGKVSRRTLEEYFRNKTRP